MAKYTITHTCGCIEEIQLVGKHADRYSRIEWLESQDCLDCMAKAAAEANATLPRLVGTERQIAWAEQIRAKAAEYPLFDQIKEETSAAWWIEHRTALHSVMADRKAKADLEAITAQKAQAEEAPEIAPVSEARLIECVEAQFSEEDAQPIREAVRQAAKTEWTPEEILSLDGASPSQKISILARPDFLPAPLLHEYACRCAEYALGVCDIHPLPFGSSHRAISAMRLWLQGRISESELHEASRDAHEASITRTGSGEVRHLYAQSAAYMASLNDYPNGIAVAQEAVEAVVEYAGAYYRRALDPALESITLDDCGDTDEAETSGAISDFLRLIDEARAIEGIGPDEWPSKKSLYAAANQIVAEILRALIAECQEAE